MKLTIHDLEKLVGESKPLETGLQPEENSSSQLCDLKLIQEIVNNDYSNLVQLLEIAPVSLDIYVPSRVAVDRTSLGTPRSNFTPLYVNDATLSRGQVLDFPSLAGRLKQKNRTFDTWLVANLSSSTQGALESYFVQRLEEEAISRLLLREINQLLLGPSIYEKKRCAGITLQSETETLISRNPQGRDLRRLNRLLVEDAYPTEVSKSQNRELIALPIDLYTQSNRTRETFVFPPTGWDRMENCWPEWRLNLWHEVLHQVEVEILKVWDGSKETHDESYKDAIKYAAAKISTVKTITPEQLRMLTLGA